MKTFARFLCCLVVVLCATARADIFRWDNSQLIPGTEGITPGPGVVLDHRELAFAALSERDLTGARFDSSNLTRANLFASTLTNANLTGAVVTGASFGETTARGFTQAQLASTASYQAKNLQGIGLGFNNLTGWDFSGQDLTNAYLDESTLTDTNLTGAVVKDVEFGQATSRGFTQAQLASTASYQTKNLQGIALWSNDLSGWDFSGQNLTNAYLASSTLTDANLAGANLTGAFMHSVTLTNADLRGANLTNTYLWEATLIDANLTGAVVTGAGFGLTTGGVTQAQLASTASYQTKNLRGIGLVGQNLDGWDFNGQNLTGANLEASTLNNADLTGADTRGAQFSDLARAISWNTILPDGTINGLDLAVGETLVAHADVPIAVQLVGGFSIDPTAKLDLTDNAAIVHYTGASPVTTVRDQILSGRGRTGLGGTWTGSGITSSTAATANQSAPDSRSLGYAENSALPLGSYANFRGQAVNDSSILIAYTRTGDANLDGVVDDTDVTIVSATYAPGVPQPHWALGDFDFNGFVDDADVTLLGAFYNPSAEPFMVAGSASAAAGNFVPVPEPSTFALFSAMAAVVLFCRRFRAATVASFNAVRSPFSHRILAIRQILCGTVALCLYLAAPGPARCGTIYWSQTNTGVIRRANLDGSVQATVVTGQSGPVGPALDLAAGQMYWGQILSSSIRRANLDGTGQTDIVTGKAGPGVPALDLGGGRMYWNNAFGGSFQSANLDGTGQATLATGQSNPHAVHLDLAGGQLYWPDFGAGNIHRVNVDGTGLTTLVSGLTQPAHLALDTAGGKMYWSNRGPDDIRRANLDGSGQETIISNQNDPAGIALDFSGGKMYWANFGGGEIRRANLDGSGLETLFTGLAGPNWIALDLVHDLPLPTWNIDTHGNWSAAGSWTNSVPNGAGLGLVLGGVITSPRTVTVDRPITVGRVDFDNTMAYTIAGSSTFTLDSTSGEAQINVASGSHTISAPFRLLDNTTITVTPAASNLSLTGPTSFVGHTVTKTGAGTLTLNNVRAAALSVNSGTVAIAPSGTTAGTSVLGSLSIAGDATPTAKFDLADNAAIINYTGASPAATIRQQIISGRGGPGFGATWTGQGITSSAAAAAVATDAESRSIGYAENASLPLGPYATFRGQAVDDTSILMAYTRTGDANLDGVVDDADVTIVSATYAPGVPQPHWALGDFDYNGFVDDADVTLLGAFYDPSAPPLVAPAPAEAIGVAAVPEPGTVALVLAGLAAVLLARATKTGR